MPFELSIVTPEGVRYEGPVESIVLPGSEGQLGVLPGHVRLLAPLVIGEAVIQMKQGTLYAALSDGFVEVTQDHVVVMVETCEFGADIDLARAQRAKARAEAALASKTSEHLCRLEEAALKRAIVRIAVANERGQRS